MLAETSKGFFVFVCFVFLFVFSKNNIIIMAQAPTVQGPVVMQGIIILYPNKLLLGCFNILKDTTLQKVTNIAVKCKVNLLN